MGAADRSGRFLPGKIPWAVVAEHVGGVLPAEVVLGPALGEDAALLRLGGELWAVASDPISFSAADAGRLAVLVNANDVAVRGAVPRFFLAVLLVAPDEADCARVHELLAQIRQSCDELGVALVGGHSEVTPGLCHSMVVGTMLGKVAERPLTSAGLQPGDRIGMSKMVGLEGTAILLAEHAAALADELAGEALRTPHEIVPGEWLSVVPEAAIAAANPAVSALHDATEGGVGEALAELAEASQTVIEVARERLPLLPETRILCEVFGLDPLGLISSGALLVGCAAAGADELERSFAAAGIPFAWIGVARAATQERPAGCNLPRFRRDELLKLELLAGVEALLFDMDGTLVDSRYDWVAIRQELGVEGASIIDELDRLAEPARSERWRRLHELERRASDGASLMHGVHELLDLLRQWSVPTALITNNSQRNTDALLERFELHFDVVLSRDCGLYKPSGAPLLEAARRLGVAIEGTLAVGDSAYDVQAARDAGCRAVVIVNGGSCELAPDLRFPDIAALSRCLRVIAARV